MSYAGVAASGYIWHSTNSADTHDFLPLAGDASGLLTENTVVALRRIKIQDGTPADGSILKYIQGHNEWRFLPDLSGGGAATAHKLLGTLHSDTTDNSPTRGALVYGSGASPSWNALAKGLTGQIPQYDATDILTDYIGNQTPGKTGTSGAPTFTFVGDQDCGLFQRTMDRVGVAASGRMLVEASAPDLSFIFYGGQIWNMRRLTAGTTINNLDHVVVCNFNNGTVTLPATGLVAGKTFIIKNGDGTASNANPITIDGNGLLIDGNFVVRIRNSYGSYTLLFNGIQYNVI